MHGSTPRGSSPTHHQRTVAALIDGIIATALAALLSGTPLLGGLVMGTYVVGRDGLDVGPLHFCSVGKYVMGLRLASLDGRPLTMATSVHRNWMLGVNAVAGLFVAVPVVGGALASLLSLGGLGLILFELYNVFADAEGRRWGDRLGRTQVVATEEGLL
jgi:uncharacterized RDD family membrane protein YckC